MRQGEMHVSNPPATAGVAGVTSVNTRSGVVTLVPSDVGITAAVNKGVVYMDGATYANSAAFTWDKTTHTLTLGGGVDGTLTLGATPFSLLESSAGVLQLGIPGTKLDTNTSQFLVDFGTGTVFTADLSSFNLITLQSSAGLDLSGITGVGSNTISIAPHNSDEIDFTLATGLGTFLLGTSFQPQADGSLDLGQTSTPRRWGSGFFSTTVQSPLFQVASTAGNTGITTTITTASLVGKTITVKGGIITGFA